jgi:hypothetical protein
MDYHHPFTAAARNSKVDIAMVMLPSINHTFARDFSVSPLLVNLGGPGGSSISFALGAAERLRQVVGEGQDIIGFDPRGSEGIEAGSIWSSWLDSGLIWIWIWPSDWWIGVDLRLI